MKEVNVLRGAMQISSTQFLQYLVYGTFYVVVTKTGALTQTDIGVFSILSFLAETTILLASLALPTAMTKFMAEDIARNEHCKAATVRKTVSTIVIILYTTSLGLISFLSGTLSQYFLGTSMYAPLIIITCVYAWLSGLAALYKSSMQALGSFGRIAIMTVVHVVSSRIVASLLAMFGLGVSGVLVGFAIGYAMAIVVAFLYSGKRLPNSEGFAPIRPLLKFGFPLILGSLLSLVIGWADIVILASMTSNYELLGVYYIVLNSIGVLSLIWAPVTYTIFPLLSAQHGLSNIESISKTIKTTSRYLAYLVFPSCLGLATIAPTALEFFYGESYASGTILLSVLSLGTIMLALSSVLTTTLKAMGKTTSVLRINIASAISNVAFLVLFVPAFEATGAVFARCIVFLTNFLAVFYLLRKEVDIQFDTKALWKSLAGSVSMLPYLALVEYTLSPMSPFLLLAIEIVGAGSIYLFCLSLLGAFDEHDFELLRQAFPKLSRYIAPFEKILLR